MFKLNRLKENPILLPGNEPWESEAAFNGCMTKEGDNFHLLYRAMSSLQNHEGHNMSVSSIGYAQSNDGIHLKNRRQLIKPEYDWEIFGCEDPRITKLDDKYYIFYTALSTYPFTADGIKIGVAVTKDLRKIEEKHPVTTFNSKAMAIFPERINGKIIGILSVNTDRPPAKIAIAAFDEESQIWSKEYWEDWYSSLDNHVIPLLQSSNDQVEVGAPPIKTKDGWLVLYSYIKNYLGSHKNFGIEAILLDPDNPLKVIGRTKNPMIIPEEKYEQDGNVSDIIFPSGALVHNKKLFVYYGAADTSCCLATGDLNDLLQEFRTKKQIVFIQSKDGEKKLKRFNGNPIIAPRPEFGWEAKATFNPAAIYEDGKVHIVYRAMSKDNTSVLGYASSSDGIHIDERPPEPIYIPREDFESKKKPGNSGCEDPRITKIGSKIYMCYTAFDGANPPRVALTTIGIDDFLNKRWNWETPMLISHPGVDDKDACILSKKINGKHIILHRISNCICINSVDDLIFGKDSWLTHKASLIKPRVDKWDNRKIGIAAPPIETEHGWLLLYHGVSDPGGIYKVGAVLLDLYNPAKIIGRLDYPILEPEMRYEKEGQVPNVVFPCGAVIIKGKLFVYYGGGDSVVGVSVMEADKLIYELKNNHGCIK